MKKFLLATLFFVSSLAVFSQGLYLDVGFGIGSATTKIDGTDVSALFGSSVKDIGVEFGMKLGYGPVGGLPLYVVGEFSGIGHRFYDDYNYIQFNSYLIGPGIIFYPTSYLQLAASIGFSFVANETDLPVNMYDSKSGYAWNISAAVDLGGVNHGCLIGLRYSRTNNTLEVSGAELETSLVSIFIKYAYRDKTSFKFE